MSYFSMGTCGVTFGCSYRSPDEIRRDIRAVAEKIDLMEEKLNLREVIVAMAAASDTPEALLSDLQSVVAEAEDTLSQLETLKADLSALGEELRESRDALSGWVLP